MPDPIERPVNAPDTPRALSVDIIVNMVPIEGFLNPAGPDPQHHDMSVPRLGCNVPLTLNDVVPVPLSCEKYPAPFPAIVPSMSICKLEPLPIVYGELLSVVMPGDAAASFIDIIATIPQAIGHMLVDAIKERFITISPLPPKNPSGIARMISGTIQNRLSKGRCRSQ